MKRFTIFTMIAAVALMTMACSSNQRKENSDMNQEKTKTVLVAYFSATGTTQKVAQQLAQVADADLFEITPEKPYTDADLDWHNKQSRSSVEMQDKTSRPAITGKVENMDQYTVIYVGFPIWWYTAPTIVNSFLDQYDLTGKTIIPFATSGGSTVDGALKDLKAAYPQANWQLGVTNPTDDDLKNLVEANK